MKTAWLQKRGLIALMVAVPIGYGLFAITLGQDADYDLIAYHYFGPFWAFANHFNDVAPVQQQTYISPLLDTPFYFAANHLPARLVGFGVGATEGLVFPFLYLIARELTRRRWLSVPLAGLGMFTAGTWSEAGTIRATASLPRSSWPPSGWGSEP